VTRLTITGGRRLKVRQKSATECLRFQIGISASPFKTTHLKQDAYLPNFATRVARNNDLTTTSLSSSSRDFPNHELAMSDKAAALTLSRGGCISQVWKSTQKPVQEFPRFAVKRIKNNIYA